MKKWMLVFGWNKFKFIWLKCLSSNSTLKNRMRKRNGMCNVCAFLLPARHWIVVNPFLFVLLPRYPALSCSKFYSTTVLVLVVLYICICVFLCLCLWLWQFGGTNQSRTWKNVCVLAYTCICIHAKLHDTFEWIAWSNVMSNNVLIMA